MHAVATTDLTISNLLVSQQGNNANQMNVVNVQCKYAPKVIRKLPL